MNWDHILKTPQAEYPNEIFVRFVAHNYYSALARREIRFLDLGSGGGANSKFLRDKGFNVVAVDSSPSAVADHYCEIDECVFLDESFDCILDHNTLCHVENPPFDKIKNWLAPEGKFFSVCPTAWTWRDHLKGKGFCRTPTRDQARKLYSTFSNLQINWSAYPDRGHEISSWIIEGQK